MQPNLTMPDDTPASILKKTPFHMEENWDLVMENKNPTCSHAEIDTLIQKRIINLVDIELIKTLACFPLTNIHNIAFHINNSGILHKNYQKASYLDNLNKLKRAGIIARYCFTCKPGDCIVNPAKAVSPLRLYSLTPPALSYIMPLLSDAHPLPMASDTLRKLEIAAMNQFLIHFQAAYSAHIKHIDYLRTVKHGTSSFVIDAILQYCPQNPAFHMAGNISLILLTVRETGAWTTRTVHRLKLLHAFLARTPDKYRLPFYLILAENISMIVELYPYLQTAPLSEIPFYFLLDTTVGAYPPFDCIYTCQQSEEDSSVTVIRNTIVI